MPAVTAAAFEPKLALRMHKSVRTTSMQQMENEVNGENKVLDINRIQRFNKME